MDYAKTVDEEIIDYLPHLNDEQKQRLLMIAKSFAEEGDGDWWDELSEEQRQAIDESIAEADAGNMIPHEEVMKKYEKWTKAR